MTLHIHITVAADETGQTNVTNNSLGFMVRNAGMMCVVRRVHTSSDHVMRIMDVYSCSLVLHDREMGKDDFDMASSDHTNRIFGPNSINLFITYLTF